MDRQLVVGLELGGAPPDVAGLAALGRRAEAAGLGFVTLADATAGPGTARLDPVAAAAFLSAHTEAIGLVPMVHTAHAEPFHVSNQLSSLDLGSRGRAGWLVGTEATPARAAAHAVRHVGDPRTLAAEAADVVDAARRLWDSWQDDAIVADETTGRFLDADRVHHVDFESRTFGIRGPALLPRPPQGQVPVVAPEGVLPAELVDVEIVRGDGLRTGAPRVVAEIEIGQAGAGAAAELVDALTRLVGVVDGVRLLPTDVDRDLALLAAEVLPALPLRRPAPGETLRDLFALPRPAGRYAS
ncbi:LLM class flavin-dependent oxidoreductase [Pseudonocardia oroxyli]|uniref:Flavin-dependent oxidoreductase, luciferase family (Includes alkanesulfonate monooxygenase SsuD and methylene tetrahydromethanopterin reductase) n=1 Tax=Pseudonocardia oroxyli TaxID=366584 RepID=A0A1G8E7M7_PSEOR|nr:LLM class flavin-dependent oxidoreductase [Pseudonocardia oroxyli]SDH65978.1 Flavin-dependent oxidoreductase, luciferase family (includes alkanesulfonate monooxygenase SsuD and methylene tetrahydromethanopterin reductase) [Pseudonocardia oroxyli]